MCDDIKEILKKLEKVNVPLDRIKSITLYWEKVLDDKAFPKIIIKLYKNEN